MDAKSFADFMAKTLAHNRAIFDNSLVTGAYGNDTVALNQAVGKRYVLDQLATGMDSFLSNFYKERGTPIPSSSLPIMDEDIN